MDSMAYRGGPDGSVEKPVTTMVVSRDGWRAITKAKAAQLNAN